MQSVFRTPKRMTFPKENLRASIVIKWNFFESVLNFEPQLNLDWYLSHLDLVGEFLAYFELSRERII